MPHVYATASLTAFTGRAVTTFLAGLALPQCQDRCLALCRQEGQPRAGLACPGLPPGEVRRQRERRPKVAIGDVGLVCVVPFDRRKVNTARSHRPILAIVSASRQRSNTWERGSVIGTAGSRPQASSPHAVDVGEPGTGRLAQTQRFRFFDWLSGRYYPRLRAPIGGCHVTSGPMGEGDGL
jgi:hypothetical protein